MDNGGRISAAMRAAARPPLYAHSGKPIKVLLSGHGGWTGALRHCAGTHRPLGKKIYDLCTIPSRPSTSVPSVHVRPVRPSRPSRPSIPSVPSVHVRPVRLVCPRPSRPFTSVPSRPSTSVPSIYVQKVVAFLLVPHALPRLFYIELSGGMSFPGMQKAIQLVPGWTLTDQSTCQLMQLVYAVFYVGLTWIVLSKLRKWEFHCMSQAAATTACRRRRCNLDYMSCGYIDYWRQWLETELNAN